MMDLATETEMITTIDQLKKNVLIAEVEMNTVTGQLGMTVLIAEVVAEVIKVNRLIYILYMLIYKSRFSPSCS
jgi:hypothetical protein